MNFAEKTTMQIDDDNCLFISVPELEMFDLSKTVKQILFSLLLASPFISKTCLSQ